MKIASLFLFLLLASCNESTEVTSPSAPKYQLSGDGVRMLDTETGELFRLHATGQGTYEWVLHAAPEPVGSAASGHI